MRFPAACAALGLTALAGALVATQARGAGAWPTEGHDARRSGQSAALGPATADDFASLRFTGEQAINMPPAVGPDGTVYVGTWGRIRSLGAADRTAWDKLDGKLFALRPDLSAAWDAPFAAERVPYCYHRAGRAETPGHCPTGGTVSFYNGTVEGTPAFSADGRTIYVGRGDGKLYAVDAATGAGLWTFTTFDPTDPADPDGGGEVIAAPLVAADGTIYFATAGAGPYETNAVYAVDPGGALLWRYPAAAASNRNSFVAAPALSPDGETLYVAGAWGPAVDDWDRTVPGSLLAFDLTAAGDGDQRVKWVHEPINEGEFWRPTVWTTALAVGSDGTLYGSGPELTFGAGSAVAYALADRGDHAEPAWPRMVDLDRNRAYFTLGLALREAGGVTRRVYATSGSVFSPLLQGYADGGKLYALDPATGNALWPEPFDPSAHGGSGGMTGLAVGADGTVYTGVSGRRDGGRVFAVGPDGELRWSFAVEGLLEWGHPVLGPEGNLYFADTHRHACTLAPAESGACDGFDVDPRVYVVYAGPDRSPCVADETTACLSGDRFELRLDWRTRDGNAGPGRFAPQGSDSSRLLWFFRADNWEMLVKLLDGCPVNGRTWVFYAAPTNVEFTLRVRDTESGAVREYHNEQGHPADPVTDTAAFGCG